MNECLPFPPPHGRYLRTRAIAETPTSTSDRPALIADGTLPSVKIGGARRGGAGCGCCGHSQPREPQT